MRAVLELFLLFLSLLEALLRLIPRPLPSPPFLLSPLPLLVFFLVYLGVAATLSGDAGAEEVSSLLLLLLLLPLRLFVLLLILFLLMPLCLLLLTSVGCAEIEGAAVIVGDKVGGVELVGAFAFLAPFLLVETMKKISSSSLAVSMVGVVVGLVVVVGAALRVGMMVGTDDLTTDAFGLGAGAGGGGGGFFGLFRFLSSFPCVTKNRSSSSCVSFVLLVVSATKPSSAVLFWANCCCSDEKSVVS